mmetsp:Transcript_18658/g.55473  ORF Transcript_18658/g.55473 Transcript_18658/m.55473 type:complete len:120 (+) Transcript_18658:384-743(+)
MEAWEEEEARENRELDREVRLYMKTERRRCDFCGKQDELTEPPLRVCGGCRSRKYCSRACQRDDWYRGPNHDEEEGPHREECPNMCAEYAMMFGRDPRTRLPLPEGSDSEGESARVIEF